MTRFTLDAIFRLHPPPTTPAGLSRLVLYCPDDDNYFAYLLGAIAERADPVFWVGTEAEIDTVTYWFRESLLATARKEKAVFIGQVLSLAGPVTDDTLLLCDGSEVSQTSYPDLYTVLGNLWGSAGAGMFRLPDLRSRTTVFDGTGVGLSERIVGENGGHETVTLDSDNLPSHNHSVHSHLEGLAFTPGELPVTLPNLTPATTGDTGSGTAHENMPPFAVLLPYIVAR